MAAGIRDPRLFDVNPHLGTTEWFHYDPDTDGFVLETVQDVEPLIEQNKDLFNNAPLRYGEWSHVAALPTVIVMLLAKQGILSASGAILDDQRFRAWLNDRDNRAFRTRPGRV